MNKCPLYIIYIHISLPVLLCDELTYTKPISDIIAGHGLSHHCYADDTQLYIAIEHSANLHSELLRMERCVADIRN